MPFPLSKGRVFFVLSVLLLMTYLFVIDFGDFYGDDLLRIYSGNSLNSLTNVFTQNLFDRPILMLTFFIEKNTIGLSPYLQRLTNILLLAYAGVSFYQLSNLLQEIHLGHSKKNLSFCLSIIFCLHTLNHQLIMLIIQRGVILSLIFGMLTISAFLKWIVQRKKIFYLLSLLFFLLGILSKPNIFFIPLFLLCYLFIFNPYPKKNFISLTPLFLICLIPAFIYFGTETNRQLHTLPSLQYFMVQTEVTFDYLKKMIFPYNLQFFYDYYPSLEKMTLYLSLHLLFAFLLKKYLFTTKSSFLFFLGVYFAFAPESSIFPIHHLAFDHRANFPLAFLFMAISITPKPTFLTHLKLPLFFSTFIFIAYFSIFNFQKNEQFSSEEKWGIKLLSESHLHALSNIDGIISYLSERNFKNSRLINNLKIEHMRSNPRMNVYLALKSLIDEYEKTSGKPLLLREVALKHTNLFLSGKIDLPSSARILKFIFFDMKMEMSRKSYCSFVYQAITPSLHTVFSNKEFHFLIQGYFKSLFCELGRFSQMTPLPANAKIEIIKIQTILKYYFRIKIDVDSDLLKWAQKNAAKNKEVLRCFEIIKEKGRDIPDLPLHSD